jgi:hypothetical protein
VAPWGIGVPASWAADARLPGGSGDSWRAGSFTGRSIYGLWRGVLEYFDAHVVGLTATPTKQTLGFFQQNLVSEYTYEMAVDNWQRWFPDREVLPKTLIFAADDNHAEEVLKHVKLVFAKGDDFAQPGQSTRPRPPRWPGGLRD